MYCLNTRWDLDTRIEIEINLILEGPESFTSDERWVKWRLWSEGHLAFMHAKMNSSNNDNES